MSAFSVFVPLVGACCCWVSLFGMSVRLVGASVWGVHAFDYCVRSMAATTKRMNPETHTCTKSTLPHNSRYYHTHAFGQHLTRQLRYWGGYNQDA